jgi:hypothetical protein
VRAAGTLAVVALLGCLTPPSTQAPVGSEALLDTVGFWSRASWSSTVLHLDRARIGGTPRLTSVLRRSDEIDLGTPEGAGWGLFMRDSDGRRGCPLAVYVNGRRVERVQRPGSELSLDDLVSARSLSGVEVHAGPDGPVRLTSECGALLMWIADTWEASDTFRGRIIAVVEGPRADTVTSVTLHPGGEEGVEEEGRYLFSVLPGAYSVTFSTEGEALGVQPARVYAHHDSRVSLSVYERF